MAAKQWVIGSSLLVCGLILIIMGAVTPLIVDSSLKSSAKEKAILQKSNHVNYWGSVPGDLTQVIFQTFNFYSIENPDAVLWNGAVPILTEMNGYVYQELDDLVDLTYSNGSINYFNYRRLQKTENCVWSNFTSPDDQVTTVNIAAFGEWNLLKNLPRQKLALYTLFDIYQILVNDFELMLYSVSVFPSVNNFTLASPLFTNAGIDLVQAQLIFNDPYYGFGSLNTFQIWVQVMIENVQSNIFTPNMTGSLFTISTHFGLSLKQIQSFFSGQFLLIYIEAIQSYYNIFSVGQYKCPKYNNMNMCDPQYLGALQWATSAVTLNPPNNIFQSTPSLTYLFPNITGFPEISNFIESTQISQKYPAVSFTVSNFQSLFNLDKDSGWPIYDPSSLMDVGRINTFFELSSLGLFNETSSILNLPSTNAARVLWDYVNALVDLTALQGRFDPAVYNMYNRGISSEYGLGLAGSQIFQSTLDVLQQELPLSVTAVYDFLTIEYHLNLTCEDFINDNLPEASYLCYIDDLEWQNNTIGFQKWLEVYWYGVDSVFGDYFMNISGLTAVQMVSLFGEQSTLSQNFSKFDSDLMTQYNCTNAGTRCSASFLAAMQWGFGLVSMNFPKIFEDFGIGPSDTVFGIPELNLDLDFVPEYFAYTSGNNSLRLSTSFVNFALSNQFLFNPVTVQKFFIYVYELNYTAIQDEFGVVDSDFFALYLRKVINEGYFGGIFQSQSVNDILFNNNNEIVQNRMIQNPLQGGDPALSYSQIRLGMNQTREEWEYVPQSMKSSMSSGNNNYKDTRKYTSYLGQNYMNLVKEVYYGEGPNGPVVQYTNINPWQQPLPIQGTDGINFHPAMSTSDSLYYYYDQASISLALKYNSTVTKQGLDCYRFMVTDQVFQNYLENPQNLNLNAYGPSGLLNLTTQYDIPLFLSVPYFYNADPRLNELVQYTTLQFNIPSQYTSYFDIEKYSGTVFNQIQQFQINAELKRDALFPNLGETNWNNQKINTYLPIYFVQRQSLLNSNSVNTHFNYISSALQASDAVFIVGLIVGPCLLIAFGLFMLKIKITRDRKNKASKLSEVKHPILLA